MNNSDRIIQNPAPGTRVLLFRGDTKIFTLSLPREENGSAWLRTNIGHAEIARKEIIREVLNDEPPLGRDWFDIPMSRVDDLCFQVTLHFERLRQLQEDSFQSGCGHNFERAPSKPSQN